MQCDGFLKFKLPVKQLAVEYVVACNSSSYVVILSNAINFTPELDLINFLIILKKG